MDPQDQITNHKGAGSPGGKKPGQNEWLSQSIVMFARFSSWVAGPVLVGIILGKWLAGKFEANGQLIFLACIGTSFIISMIGLVIEANREYKKISDEGKNKDETKK